MLIKVAVWLNGSAMVLINEVAVCCGMGNHFQVGRPSWYVTSTQVNSA